MEDAEIDAITELIAAFPDEDRDMLTRNAEHLKAKRRRATKLATMEEARASDLAKVDADIVAMMDKAPHHYIKRALTLQEVSEFQKMTRQNKRNVIRLLLAPE